eukprot:Plantae.Rhodophyta-Palmaria_palmata.ctg18601.p1 GENE.Plantae.Rhodophyta-Palmaria_palmata.ctg18601~~Plantae.Rhodophyta-Palmaria_palmata.ctg18601.p1  ORF type:complete len:114 (+),score=26.62 Plantae.Rhodophyta-Palmaria_palmata.ctg18601:270-611(+)
MRRHVDCQHVDKWTEYKSLSDEDKKTFFDSVTSVRDTLQELFEGKTEICFDIERDVVRVLVADILLDEEKDGPGAKNALGYFTILEEDDESDGGESEDESYYTVFIRPPRLLS